MAILLLIRAPEGSARVFLTAVLSTFRRGRAPGIEPATLPLEEATASSALPLSHAARLGLYNILWNRLLLFDAATLN